MWRKISVLNQEVVEVALGNEWKESYKELVSDK
jgi:hypothetical protein